MQAGKAQESDEGEEINSRGSELDLGSEYLFFMDGPVFLDEDDTSAVTTSFGEPQTVSPVFGATGNAPPPANLSWESPGSLAHLLREPETWIEPEEEHVDEEEFEQQKLEDIESYLLNTDEEEDDEEQNRASASAQPHPDEPIIDVVSDDPPEATEEAPLELVVETGGIEESSPEAAALRELENAVAKLDNGTRFSIRDALYRLAENAARRHAIPENDCRMSTHSFETSTNSLDRSIASFLFHKQAFPAMHQPQQLLQQQQAFPSCVPSGVASGHRPQPQSTIKARPPLLHKHPCAGKLSNNNNILQQQAAAEKSKLHYLVTQKPRIADLGARKQRVTVSKAIPRKRIKLNPASSLAV